MTKHNTNQDKGVEVIIRYERGKPQKYSFDEGKTWLTQLELKKKQRENRRLIKQKGTYYEKSD